MGFSKLELSENIQKTLKEEGYSTPTPIQAEAIPQILAGKDVLGIAQTGTGKTAAFALPIIQKLSHSRVAAHAGSDPGAHDASINKSARKTRSLILSPTRELAGQIEESFKTYGRGTALRIAVIYGGVSQEPQVKALRHGVDVIVATPGRLLDLINQGMVDLRHIQVFVLDEADQMLDMGFIYDIRKIVTQIPKQRQSLMFSATMPPEIRKLADTILTNPVTVQVSKTSSTADTVDHSILFVDTGQKTGALVSYLKQHATGRTLVFTRTKHGADKVVRHIESFGIPAAALHANKSQGQRRRAMAAFKSQRPPVLVATDIAARGLDIDDIQHVINFNIPNVPETYVHRIGRTGRAGAAGTAISLCDYEERAFLRGIEKLIGKKVPVLRPDFTKAPPEPEAPADEKPRRIHKHAAPAPKPLPDDSEDFGVDVSADAEPLTAKIDRLIDDEDGNTRAPAHRPAHNKPHAPAKPHSHAPQRPHAPHAKSDAPAPYSRPAAPFKASPADGPRRPQGPSGYGGAKPVAPPLHRPAQRRPGGGAGETSFGNHGAPRAPEPRPFAKPNRPHVPRPASAHGGQGHPHRPGGPKPGGFSPKPGGFAPKPSGFGPKPSSFVSKPGAHTPKPSGHAPKPAAHAPAKPHASGHAPRPASAPSPAGKKFGGKPGGFKRPGTGINQWGYAPNKAGGKSQKRAPKSRRP